MMNGGPAAGRAGRASRAEPHRPGASNGMAPGAPNIPLEARRLKPASAPLAPFTPPQRRGGQGGERGPLIENVPRRMRVNVPAAAEVRIPRERLDALVQALASRGGAQRGEPVIARALSVRLRAAQGALFVEPASPETLWVESGHHGVQEEGLVWRWKVTPQGKGKNRLVLQVTMRSVGPDGAGAEAAPPDRSIDVKVSGRRGRILGRLVMWLVLLGVGVALGHFGPKLFPDVIPRAVQLISKAMQFIKQLAGV